MWEVKQTKPLKKVNLYTKDNAQYLISIIQILLLELNILLMKIIICVQENTI